VTADAAALDGHAQPETAGTAPRGYTPRHALDRKTVDLITEQARQARPGHAFLTIIGSILFAAGWLTARTFAALFLAAAWMFTAARMGWRQARGVPLSQPDVGEVLEENARLRAAIARLGG
jgi:hypothetical protein